MATGFATEIDLSKLDKMINKLETNLQRFVDKSKDAQTQVVDAFTKMGTNGVNKFVSQLSGAINQVMEIGKKGSAIKWDSQNLNRYIDQVNQLINLVQQVGGAGFTLPTANLNKQFASISRLKDDLKVVNELLNKGEKTGVDSNGNAIYRQLVAAEQNYFVELKKNIQEQLKFQQQSIQERLASVKKALQEELKETQEIEKKKTQARNQSYKGAIKYSDKANSLEQERKAIKNLEAARESLKKTDANYSSQLEELNRRINAHRINVEAATKTEAQRNALTSSTRAEYARLLAEQDKLRQSYDKLKQSQVALGNTPETTAALQNIVKRYRDVYAEIQRYKQSANGQLDATERKFLADQASTFAENERRKTEIAQQEANKRATISSTEARKVINSASGAKNVNQQIAAIQQLKNARDKLDKTDKDYKKTLEDLNKAIKKHQEEIDKARGKVDSANNSHRRLMDTAGQLQRKLALVFSVSAIQGYISKLMQIRGEFEMQQRSLQVLLQDKDEANKLWDKTVALAVKSPFRVKDLVTYTKQLAAYRVETDKLYETNKMLADVSAGLGVDMNRLILAFGQVKAANYLRGTELRQFSEAGVNMLGELAEYFTELEGRAVSVGDVFERVSKRMVTFEHVNTIFQKITSEGGIFYKMQEKQSETLQGMIMNFRDSMDLMMNDIGKSSDSTLKGAIKLAKEFVDNWRQAEPIIKSIAYSFLAVFSIQQLSKVGNAITAIGNAIKTHPYVAALSALSAIVITCYQWANAQSKVNAALKEVEDEGLLSMRESINLYHELADTVNDVTKSHEERNKALSMLKTKLQDILPDEYLELEYIQKIKGSYKEAEEAMFAYYNAKVKAQKEDKIRTTFAESITTDTGDLTSALTTQIKEFKGWNNEIKEIMLSGISGAVNSTINDVESGKVKPENILNTISERMDKYGGKWFDAHLAPKFSQAIDQMLMTDNWSLVSRNVNQLTNSFSEMETVLSSLNGLYTETYDEYLAGEEINRETKNVEKAVELFKKASSRYEEYVRVIPTLKKDIATQRKDIEEDIQGLLENTPKEFEAYIPLLKDIFAQLKKEADKGEFDLRAAIQRIQQSLYAIKDSKGNIVGGLAKVAKDNIQFADEWRNAGHAAIKNFQEGITKEADKLDMTPMQKAVIKGARGIAKKFGVDLNLFKNFIPSSNEALSNVSKNLESYIKDWEDRIKKFKSSSSVEGFGVLSPDILTERTEEIKKMEDALPALREFAKLLGVIFKPGKTKHDKLIEEQIKIVDQMNKKYKELNKTLTKTESLQGAFAAYKDAFADAYGRNDVRKMSADEFASKVLNFPNEDDVVKWFDKLATQTKNVEDKLKVELKKGEYVYDMKVRVKAEDDKMLIENIEDMFSGYEMSIELQKLNISKDLAKQLFNVDSVDLSSIRNKIASELAKAQVTGGQEDRVKELKKQLDKVEELEDKAMKERLKKYTKYLVKAQGERVKIKMEELRQLNEIETLNFTESQKSMARMAIQQESRQKMDKLDWEDFKNSGMYVQLFEDLDLASTKALERMRNRLIEMKSSLKDLDADDLRNLYNQIEKLDNELATRNPYKHMIDGAKDYIDAIRESKRVERELDLQSQVTKGMQSKEVSLSEELAKQKTIYEQMSKSGKATKDDLDKQRLKISLLNAQLASIKAQLAAQGKLTKELEEELDGYKATRKLFTGKAGEIGKDISEVANALPQIASELENVFGTMDAGTRDTIDSIAEIGSGIGDTVQAIASGDVIGAVIGIAKTVGAIAKIGDKKKERQIQREIKFVEDLERAYQKLEKQIDKAYEFDTLKGSYDAAQKNIDAQIESYNKMIAAEDDKKKTDKDRIKEWELAIEDLKEKQRELLETQVEELGSSYDFSSITEEFVNSWLDAFKDTGNGLKGLEENFEDFWTNIALKQAVMGGASKIMQPFLDAVNKALENDFKLDESEMSNIDQLSQKAKEDMNAFLEQWYDRWGDFMTQGEQSELSGLQRGIQELTESTGQEIAAYLNSIRFFVAEQNTYLSQIAASFGNTEIENPMVGQLRIIASQTTAINELLNSLTSGGHSMGGRGFRVFIS